MLDTSSFWLAGLAGGFLSSAPIGPINLWIISRVLRGLRGQDLLWFVVGVILADILLAGAAIWGYVSVIHDLHFQFAVNILGGIIILGMGVFILIMENPQLTSAKDGPEIVGRPLRDLLTGFSFCGINPAFFTFWMALVTTLAETLDTEPTTGDSCLFLAGIVIGDAVWFWLLVLLARKGVDFIRPKASKLIRWVIGWTFIAIGSYALISLAFS